MQDSAGANTTDGRGRAPHRIAVGLLLGGAAFAVSPWATPELGLTLGLLLGLSGLVGGAAAGAKGETAGGAGMGGAGGAGAFSRMASRWLIQIAVVLLGFRMDLHKVLGAGGFGLALAVGVVVVTFILGLGLGRWLRTQRELSLLISSGTAICGGSAIAAVAATIRAGGANISVALGVVFILNAISLYIFPQIGELLKMTPRQFGTWAGIAIHDVSSVVGAASSFRRGTEEGALALETATVVKLARVLWIVPVCLVAAQVMRGGAGPNGDAAMPDARTARRSAPIVPWYVGLFLVAAVVRTLIPQVADVADEILIIARRLMTLALFLIGAGLSRQALAAVGWRPLMHSAVLWLAIAAGALVVVMTLVE